MSEAENSLLSAVVARLSARFLLQPVEAETGELLASRWSGLSVRVFEAPGTIELAPFPTNPESWRLTLRGIGSARNWFTAEITPHQTPDAAAIALLHRIDQALDGLLGRALYAREMLLAQRRDVLIWICRDILDEHAALQRLGHALDYEWGSADPTTSDGSLASRWRSRASFSARGSFTAPPGAYSELFWTPFDNNGGSNEGFRFYVECVMHGRTVEDAAYALAREFAAALGNGTITASIEPIDHAARFITDQLHAASRHSPDAPGDVGTHPASSGPSPQAATERLGL